MMIILTTSEAAAVRGPTGPGAALDPLPLVDDTSWVLPQAVLADPAHTVHHAMLAALPLSEVAPEEWPVIVDDLGGDWTEPV